MHRVVLIARSTQSAFELGLAAEMFGTERAGLPRHYELEVCAEVPGTVPTSSGWSLRVTSGLDAVRTADTVLLPSWDPVVEAPSGPLREALLHAHARGARLVAICGGTFVLAGLGLLDGRAATTHPDRLAALRRRFPAVDVVTDRPFVDHGDLATSAGAGGGTQLCLHLIRRDHGADYAARVHADTAMLGGRDPARGGTSDAALDALLQWAETRLDAPLGVEDLAARLNVSPRTLSRRFAGQLGTSPGAWITDRRVSRARALLEDTDLPVEAIARRVGLGDAVNLRRRFRARVGVNPDAYRHGLVAPGGTHWPERPPK